MKFSEFKPADWLGLKPYFDTCLLPLTGLNGGETPVEMTAALEALRDAMTPIEVPFKGRIVTLPAVQYRPDSDEAYGAQVNELIVRLKQNFRYVVVVTADSNQSGYMDFIEADLHFCSPRAEVVQQKLSDLWRISP